MNCPAILKGIRKSAHLCCIRQMSIRLDAVHAFDTLSSQSQRLLSQPASQSQSLLAVLASQSHSLLTVPASQSQSLLTVLASQSHSLLTVLASQSHSLLMVHHYTPDHKGLCIKLAGLDLADLRKLPIIRDWMDDFSVRPEYSRPSKCRWIGYSSPVGI
jgi:hypothetical protein